jgi:hypothetical protein
LDDSRTAMSRAAANEIAIRGLADIINVSMVATVVWDQGGDLSDQELMMRTFETLRVLLESGWAVIGDMVASDWVMENQKLAMVDPDEATRRLFAHSRERISQGRTRQDLIRPWPLSTDEVLARVKREWIALQTRTPGIGDIGWLLTTPAGDERGRMMLGLQRQAIDFAVSRGAGGVVCLTDLDLFVRDLAPDFSTEEIREASILALDGLLSRNLAEVGSRRGILRWQRFAPWRFKYVEEALERVRTRCLGSPAARGKSEDCAIRVLH